MQQWRHLKKNGLENPNPRQQTLTDLAQFVTGHTHNGNEVLVLIDANSHPQDTSIQQFLETTGLHDALEDYLPDTKPSTYQRGRHQIDHIWGTPGIITATLNAGILPFGQGPNSDHAMLYIDLSFDTLMGISSHILCDSTHHGFRNLWSTDIKAAIKYVELVQTGFQDENIFNRISILVSRCQRTHQCTTDDERLLNKINDDITRILLRAERHCKKARGHAWSLLLAIAGRTGIAAKWHFSDVINQRLNIRLLDRAQAIIKAKQQLKEAYKVLRQVQANARQIRDSFLINRAEHLAETRQLTKAQAIRQILQAEQQAVTFRKLGRWLKNNEHHQLTRILTPDNPQDLNTTSWTSIADADQLHDILTKEGQTHYRQAASSPLVSVRTHWCQNRPLR